MADDGLIEMEMGEELDRALECARAEAERRITRSEGFVPFTVLATSEGLTIETHPGDDFTTCSADARGVIAGADEDVVAYVFCYDGFIEYDDGKHDAVILECAERGDEEAAVLGWVYTEGDDELVFEDDPDYLGSTDGLLEG